MVAQKGAPPIIKLKPCLAPIFQRFAINSLWNMRLKITESIHSFLRKMTYRDIIFYSVIRPILSSIPLSSNLSLTSWNHLFAGNMNGPSFILFLFVYASHFWNQTFTKCFPRIYRHDVFYDHDLDGDVDL